jgi:hypothetical protein
MNGGRLSWWAGQGRSPGEKRGKLAGLDEQKRLIECVCLSV